MFIKKLYAYNKAVCVSFLAIIFLFGLINYKWGVVATPLLQYGMYSQVFNIRDTQTVYIVEANNEIINCADISLTNRDILQIYPVIYEREKQVNEAAYLTMKKYINYTGLSRYMEYAKYTNRISDSLFTNWYRSKVENVTGAPVHSLYVFRQHVVWNINKIEPVDSLTKLTYLGTQQIP